MNVRMVVNCLKYFDDVIITIRLVSVGSATRSSKEFFLLVFLYVSSDFTEFVPKLLSDDRQTVTDSQYNVPPDHMDLWS